MAGIYSWAPEIKVFCFFSSEKKDFACLPSSVRGGCMLTDQQKTDTRRFCGYPAYGGSPAGNIGWRFYVAYGLLEYRMNNLSVAEISVVANYLSTLSQLEAAVPTASDNLDTDAAASWKHNQSEIGDRLRLFDEWRRRLCSFFGVPPGDGLATAGVSWIV